ncbi:MAG: aldo/keto reductase [Proteobacteria bacterium]|nr:aldo/keto reductase [Pseudomonadota bacterium]
MDRLILGTAQLGMNYGIANKPGRPNPDLSRKIVQSAWENGIREYDTAQEYGESEKTLGKALSSLGLSSKAKIITKLNQELDHLDKKTMTQAVRESIAQLDVPALHGLMLRREEYLNLWEKGLGEIFQGFVAQGLTRYLGVSVYSPEMAILGLNTDGIDMIQLPSNILDRRFENAGVFDLAKELGKQIHVRSVFLQGLLLMDRCEIPSNMQFAGSVLEKLKHVEQETGLSRQNLAFGYAKQAYPDAKIVFGVETSEQLNENFISWAKELPHGLIARIKNEFKNVENRVLNPVLWPNK